MFISMIKKTIIVSKVRKLRGTKSHAWNSKNGSYDDDSTTSKYNVCN